MGMTRNELLLALRRHNIGASVHYQPLHSMPYYRGIDDVTLDVTDHLAGRIMTLPIGAAMGAADADCVIEHLRDILAQPEKAHGA
jgi:dTDP-4-amino-4,6-dideoxygalactose transaminase